ncbi:apolipoprotein B-100 [Ascaphus truei]|uniref:apolipoprotein B-100 n=1 Tax=Ascaphus truei TaxID=8439 RepID=UPI003F5AA04B
MGNRKLLLLVLLTSSCTLAQEDGSENLNPSCSKDASKFRNMRKYTYNYEAATSNGVTGTADSQSGSKFTCKVELEVPQPCNFNLRIKQCTLREVYGVNSDGKAMLKKSKNSEDFANAMSQYVLAFTVLNENQVVLYPQKDEALTVLNMKRGIISALLVPDETQETSNMDTVYGKCSGEMTVTARKETVPTEITMNRNLKTCDQFNPIRDYVSPIALIKGLNAPLSTLISSSQSCQYKMEPKRRHITEVNCFEHHLFLPFSHKNQYGINAKVTQILKLEEVAKINNREFDADSSLVRGLALEAANDKSLSKNGDAILENLQELQKLSTTEQNQKRASLFHKIVTGLRSLNNDTLSPLVPQLIQSSSPITLQALVQCGTPECFGGILQVLRIGDISPVLTDAITYSLGLLPSPCTKRVRELLNMAQYKWSRASFYALSHAVSNFYEDKQIITPELKDVADFMASLIVNECTEDEDKTFLSLKAIGIMGKALEDANPQIKSSLLKCVRSQTPSLAVQKASIQAFRKMTITDEVRGILVQTFQESSSPVEKRLSAYLMLMKNPSQSDLRKVIRALVKDENEQVKSFVASHIANILNSEAPETQELKGKVEESLKSTQIPSVMDFRKFSRNYKISKSVLVPGLDETLAAKAEGNVIFDSGSYMPKEAMLQATLDVFGESIDMFEVSVEGNGLEPTMEALFGKGGFFPDSAMKALYWVDGKVPDKMTEILYKWFGVSKQDKQKQDLTKAILYNVEKLIREVRSSAVPEANAYLEILGKELGYLKLSDFRILGNMLMKSLHTAQELPAQIVKAISKGVESDLFLHYIFMDNEFDLPTGAGFQLQVSLSGIITPGTRAGMKIQARNMQAELSMKPAVAVEFVTHLGIHIPEFTRHAIQMNTNMYHESGVEARMSLKEGQFKFTIPAPKGPTKLFSINNKLNLVFASKTEVMTSIIENREAWSSCRPLFTGLNYCTTVGYSNASSIDGAPYFPLTGETRFELEIQPTGEVEEYSVTSNYRLSKEGEDLVDTLKFSAQAAGTKSCEATLTMKYNRNKVMLTSDVQIPNYDVDFGVSMKVNDESTESKKSYAVILEINNQQVSEATLTGQISYDGRSEALVGGVLSIPRLQLEATTQASLQYLLHAFRLQLQSSAKVCDVSGSQSVVFTYDNNKIELEWNTGTNTNVKNMISKIPDVSFSDLSNYPEAIKKYANDVLDHKVAQSDMTLRHIVSQSLLATNNWLQKASKDIPYAVKLQNKLIALKELNLQEMGLPTFPEQLYLNSDGRIKYQFNKDSIIINIPLPFGGQSSQQLKFPRIVRSPSLDMQSMGLKIASQEFRIPAFTIPEFHQLRVPLIGVLELSSNIKSNYYNWSAIYTGGNTTSDVYTFSAKYNMRADSVLDIFSYSIDGSATTSYDPEKSLFLSYEGSMQHSLLDLNTRLSKSFNFRSNEIFKGSYACDARSILGIETSATSSVKSSMKNNILITDAEARGQFKMASLFANSDYRITTNYNTENIQAKADSTFNLDSSYLQATNTISGMFLQEAMTITSKTDLQNGAITNTMTLDYRNRQLSIKSDTNGKYRNVAALNKFDATISKQMAAIRSEYQADYKRQRFYTLLSGSLNSLGIELNADVKLNSQANRAAHKATLKINQDGLSTSATTNVNFAPLTLENELNAGIGSSGAAMKMTASGRYREHNAKLTVDGKAALTELSFGSVYQATVLSMDTKNVLNFKMNKEGLKFSNNLMGSYEQMKLENSNDLSIAAASILFTSKFENTISSDKSYKHNFDLQLQPYTMTATLNNEFQYSALELTNRGHMHLEPLQMNLNGNVRGALSKDEVKHSYTFQYKDLTASLKTDTVANIQGTAHTHRVNTEIAGLSASFSSSTNCETKSMRFTNIIRSVMAPFTITIDSHTTGDGRLLIFGEHTGQLYSKFILKAEPFAFNLDHDYRGSTGHSFEMGKTHNTLIDYKMNVLFTPSEQLSSWKLKSQLNQNTYTQDFSAYNNDEKIGIELSGQTLADLSILDRQIQLPFVMFNPIDALSLRDSVSIPQEFGISGYVKYDKNKDTHAISLPFIESMPFYFEKIKSVILTSLQALQNSLKAINIEQYIRQYKRTLDKFPQKMNDYMDSLDLEGKVNEAKERILYLTKDFKMTAEDLQIAIENAKNKFREAVSKLQDCLSELDSYIRENYDLNDLTKAIEMLIKQFVENIKALDKQYKISEKTVEMIQDLQNYVDQLDVNEIRKSAAAWMQNVEDLYQIKANLQQQLQQIQAQIQRIDIEQTMTNLKKHLQTIEMTQYVEKLKNALPIENINQIIEQIKHVIITLLEEYDASGKINAVADKLQDLIADYDVDKKVQYLMDKFIQLLNQQKVKETITAITTILNDIDFNLYFNIILTFVEDAVKQVKEYDYKRLVDDINNSLDIVIKKMKSFNYDKFVDDVNNWIREITKTLNNGIKALELPQKAEALNLYLNEVRIIVSDYGNRLKDTKLSAIMQWCQDLMSSTVLNDLKLRTWEILEDVRNQIYSMDIQMECQRYLQQVSQIYSRIVAYISQQWNIAAEKITNFAAENNIREWAEKVKVFVEYGVVIPEIKLGYINIPAFEISLNALRDATFKTPYFTVPFTDLNVPSVEFNFKRLREVEIPTRFVTPEFSILNTFRVPSYTIDLNEFKLQIVRIIDNIISSEFQWPSSEIYFKNLRISDMGFSTFSFPEIHMPNVQIPELTIPKLNLVDFQFSDIQIPEFQLPRIPHTISVPTFGKLSSSFKVTSPFFTLTTSAGVHNMTISENNPEIVASLSAEATSKIEALAFTLGADARISAPMLEQLILKESVAVSNKYVKLDHSSEITFTGSYIQSKAETIASLHIDKSSAEFHNDILVKLQKKILADINTKYVHKLNIPLLEIASQLELQNGIDSLVEAGRISITSSGKGSWKWDCPLFSDEGTHQANLRFNLNGPLIELSGANKITDKYLKLDQSMKYDSGFLDYVNIEIMSKAESPNVGNSIVSVKGKGLVGKMKVELTATHNAELSGRTTGTIRHSFSFLAQPFEMKLSTNNNGNLKVSFPLKLTGKIEFLNNYDFILNSNVQQISWQVNGRFNQYKFSHIISAVNNEENIEAIVGMNGEANLDFLTIPISIPELPLPYTSFKTPEVRDFSLWERTGLKNLLSTTKQNVDLNVKLQYKKNKDMHSIELPLEALYESINYNMKILNKKFEIRRDYALNHLMESYNQAKAKFDKYKVENSVSKVPRTFRIPGYTIPLVNIEVSPFTAELPAFGYVIPKEISTPSFMLPVLGFSIPTYTLVLPSLELPVLNVPNTLRRLTLPKLNLPTGQNNILIPAMGNLTYDFSFKSNVISLTTSAGLYNQSDISARISVTSTSVIDALQFNIDGTTGLTRKRGLKLATALALKTAFMEGKHESSMSFGKRNIEASVITNGEMNIPLLQLQFQQELTGNTKTKPTISSKMTMSYDFNDSKYGNTAKGTLDHTLSLESLTSYLSLESVTKGDITGTILSNQGFSGKLTNEASTYLNSNGARSSIKLVGNSKADGFGTLDIIENLAIEATTRRIYAVWEHSGENDLRLTPAFTTRGDQNCKATLELALWSLLANLQLEVNQPNSYFEDASLSQSISLSMDTEKQEFGFNGQGILQSVILAHNLKLSNDKTDARFDIAGSLQGHVDFLQSVILPVYEKSIWDVLKCDLTTTAEKKQYLNVSTSLIYTKNTDGFFFPIPVNKLADGFIITIPALTLQVPKWMKELPSKVSNLELPDPKSFNILEDMPTVLEIPSFKVPFTNLQVPSYKMDINNIKIHKKLSTLPFDLSLPSLPTVKFPKVDITTKYITMEEYKIPFFEVTIPQYQITLARYTLPKSFYNLDFNNIVNKLADIDLPTIEIPEQNIEIPPVKMSLPGGLFIPAFGALTGSVQIASPIYNLTWTTKLKNNSDAFVASIDATCSSTLQFLEYDLEASTTGTLNGNILNLNGKGTLAHPDLSIDWQQDVSFEGLRMPSHAIEIDITSPTFTNVQIRCKHEANRISSSVTSPSTGSLGLLLEKDPTTLKGKLFSRSLTSPGKDTLILKGEISLKNPEKIQNKINWKEDAAQDVVNGLKERLPKMSDAIYKCINKYHKEHFGMNIKDATLMMKEDLQSKVVSTYTATVNQIDKVEHQLYSAVRGSSGRYSDLMKTAQKWYKEPADQPILNNYHELKIKFYDNSIVFIREYQKTVKGLIDAAIKFVKSTKFKIPGQSEIYTGEELYAMIMQKALLSIEQFIQSIQQYFEGLVQSVNDVEISVPGTGKTIQGKQILSELLIVFKDLQQITKAVFTAVQKVNIVEELKQFKNLVQETSQKAEKIIEALKSRNYEDMKAQTQQMYSDAINSEYARNFYTFAGELNSITSQLQKYIQSWYEELSEKLEQLLIYAKALREEYLDPNIMGWSVKYYEIEGNIVQLIKIIIDSLRDFHASYVSGVAVKVQIFVEEYYELANNLVTNADDKGRQKIMELSKVMEEKIRDWSKTAKKFTEEHKQILSVKLQDTYDQFVNSYERLIAEANRLIDLAIQKYNSCIEFIMQLLQNIQNSANEGLKTYVTTRKGELKIDVPHPLDWKSFDDMPQLRSDIISKRMEVARSLVQDGIDKGSRKWEELQSFIEQQLEDGKLSAQQIIENIRNWKKN